LRRLKAKKEPYHKVLIVTEGSKTEPHYFQELKDYYKLSSANVRITGDCGSDPVSVVKFGKALYRKEKKKGDPFDRVFCVIDKDTHANFAEAINILLQASPKGTFIATASVPCFEYWFLLHFQLTTAPFTSVGTNSACKAVMGALHAYWPEYAKGTDGSFGRLLNHLEVAIRNAERCLLQIQRARTDNPSTRVHELVSYLRDLKKSGNQLKS
jgi:hypothetical protein